MKRTHKITLALGLTSILALTACGSGDSSADGGDEAKVLHVGATGQSYPFAYKEGDKLQGFDVEVIEHVADKIGYDVDWTLMEFSGVMGQLQAGKLDTVANQVAVTDERKELYDFSDTYSYAGTQIVVAEDNDEINGLEDLAGKEVMTVLGSNHAKNLESKDPDGKINIRTYETQEGTLNDVALGRVDAYVNGRSVLLAQLELNDLPLKLVGDPIVYEEVGFPFSKENAELREDVNQALEELRADGTLSELSEKYFKDDVTEPISEEQE